ncbi:MAG: hypothetical protein AAF655_12710 [Bacteroidota bacterium]
MIKRLIRLGVGGFLILMSFSLLGKDTLTYELEALWNLDQNWKDVEGREYQIPFWNEDKSEWEVSLTFSLPCSPDDTVYLWFERLIWQAEIEFNQYYVNVSRTPFQGFAIPLSPDWFQEENKLKVSLIQVDFRKMYPPRFLGILDGVYLLNKEQLTQWQADILPRAEMADTVAIIAPYYGENVYGFDRSLALRNLLPVINERLKHIYFAYEPDRELRYLCKELGLIRVDSLTEDTQVAWVHAYKYEASTFPYPTEFWLDERGNRSSGYGTFRSLNQASIQEDPQGYSLGLVLMMCFPVLGLFIMKLLNPAFIQSLLGLFISPKLFIDTFVESTYSNLGLLFILILMKVLALAFFLSLLLYYVSMENQWGVLSLLKTSSLAGNFFYGTQTLSGLFWKSMLLLSAWVGVQYILLSIIGAVYRIKNLAMGVFNLEIVGGYPLILFLSIPLSLMFFTPSLWGGVWKWVLILLLLTYFLRKIYVQYVGLDRLFTFSYGMKILYICAFNMLPYIIWL